MKVCDLIAPWKHDYGNGPNIVRFCWSIEIIGECHDPFNSTICVIDKDGRNNVSRKDARDLWRRLRKAGWTVSVPTVAFPKYPFDMLSESTG